MLICALTNVAPFYDCPPWYDGNYNSSTGDIWFIAIWNDDNVPCWKDEEIVASNGCVMYDSNTIYVSSKTNGNISQTPLWEGMTTLQHEIEHLKCQCSWHET